MNHKQQQKQPSMSPLLLKAVTEMGFCFLGWDPVGEEQVSRHSSLCCIPKPVLSYSRSSLYIDPKWRINFAKENERRYNDCSV